MPGPGSGPAPGEAAVACPPRSLAGVLADAPRPWLADGAEWRSGRDILQLASRYRIPALRGALVRVPAETACQAVAAAVAVEGAGGVPVLWPARAGTPPYVASLPWIDHAGLTFAGRPALRWSGHNPVVGVSSGGTSGAGKVVLLDVSRAIQNAAAVAARVSMGPALRVASLRSPAFSAGLVCDILGSLLAGEQVMPIPVSSALLGLRAVLGHRPDAVHAAPAVLNELLDRLPPVRRFVLSGEPFPVPLLGKLRERFPSAVILNGYGLSEAGPRVSVGPAKALRDGIACGLPLPGVTLRAVDSNDGLVVTTPYSCVAVLDISGMTQPGPQIVTRDAGRIEPDGTVVIMGRADEMVMVNGCPVSTTVVAADLRQTVPGAEVSVDPAAGSVIIGVPAASGSEEAELRRRLTRRLRRHWPMLSRVRWRRIAVVPGAGHAITEAGKSKRLQAREGRWQDGADD